ncbi:DUF4105 domain-containing protein [Sulfuricurvum sp.]|uniref:Lnb N-terminal periplasmic domain-containing protein n=1 Tax=Sulfuricurvum sp. TaxID=2025608 RepID=UPI00261E84CE|nr:DUF4105 domain-containing protein [Sulfuricurvum sp.]MDD4883673.1 DUF4105 domain-containing protein [Sulfuricurvum sp.]
MPVLFLLCVLSLAVYATSTDELTAQAHIQKLSESRYWHLLMHAPKEESEIDDDRFFLASEGKTNLSAELDATIRYFSEDNNRSDGSVFCRFPARRAWLEKELNTSFGTGECHEYEALLEKLDPQKVTLVFPSAHINSPASMFGHTFLRIDSSMESKLMSYAINYAAQTEDQNGFLFAYKGITGGYYGFYSMLPYYEKLKEYRDSESRDVWEYDLNLTHDEVMAMVRHIWELQHMNSWYYFFDENCSYNMLWLTEVARPSVHLRDHFFYYVIPPETVRAFEEESLVAQKHFRPSKRTKILAYEERLSSVGIRITQSLRNGETDIDMSGLTEQERRYILEAAAELVEYDFIEGKIGKEQYTKRYHRLLSARAVLGEGVDIPIRLKANPDSAHRSARVSVQQGWYDHRSPLLIGWRPAYHDLDEDDTGHLAGAQIEFFDASVGIDRHKIHIENLTILSLASLAPVSHFFKPFSWRMKTGWDREYGNDTLSFVARVGAGVSIGNERIFGYLLSEPEVRAGFTSDAGLGVSGGLVVNWGNRFKTHLEAGDIFYIDGKDRSRLTMTNQWGWNSRGALSLRYESVKQVYGEDRFTVGINLYF